MTDASNTSYSRALKSSAMMGGSQAITMVFGFLRAKAVAIYLGPTGLGLLGTLLSIRDTASVLSGLGIQQSGVRDVAESWGSGDADRIAKTCLTLRRVCWLSGLLGFALVTLLSEQISQMTLQSAAYSREIAWLGIAVLLSIVAGGRKAIIQGTRRIADLTLLNILSAFAGSILAVGCYIAFGMQGIVPAILCMSMVDLVITWWFSSRVPVLAVTEGWRSSLVAAGGLFSLGIAFMWNGLMVTGVDLATRSMLTYEFDLFAVGVFTAAYRVSGLLVNMVMTAMASDFFPALTAVTGQPAKMRQLVNEQTEIGLLLALPGLLLTLALAPWIIRVLYSDEFAEANGLLQWFVPGCLLKVVSWPAGYILVAKGKTFLLIASQTVLTLIHLGLIFSGIQYFGLQGVAMAFLAYNVIYLGVYMFLGNQLIGFNWNREAVGLVTGSFALTTLVFLVCRHADLTLATILALLATFSATIFCLRQIGKKLGPDHRLVKILARLPLLPRLLGIEAI